jgi:DNA-directed RNA polymerase specialized sigma24 family protein
MAADVFPQTLTTWIRDRLSGGAGGRREVDRHVMEVYAFPLRVYYLGGRDRTLGEPDEVIQGFFADRLARAEFFAQWQGSGLPLRRWLMNALNFYLKELRRANKRGAALGENQAEDPGTWSGDPNSEMERAFIISLVRTALRNVQRECDLEGQSRHWTSFYEHFYLDRSYADIGQDLGVDAARAMVMARTVRHKFQAEVRRMMTIDDADPEIDKAILSLLQGAES